MPKVTEHYYNPTTKRNETRIVGQDDDVLARGAAQDASGLGSKVKPAAQESGFKAPPMIQGESPAAYLARRNKAREEYDRAKTEGQTKAIKSLPK